MQDNTTTKSTGRSESCRFSSSSEFSKEVAKSIEQIDSHFLSQQTTLRKKHHEVNGFTFNAKPESESQSQRVISYVNGFRVSTMVNQVKYSNPKSVRNSFTFDQHHANPVSRIHSIKSQRRFKVKPNHRHEIIVRPTLLDLHENRSEEDDNNENDDDDGNEDSENTDVYDNDDDDEDEDEKEEDDTGDDDNTDVYDDDEDDDEESDGDNDDKDNDDKSDGNSLYGTAQSQNDETEYYSPRRRISRLRRIKNKLGLIFAHHRNDRHDHHDHDHHHRDRSTWKVLRGIFPHGNTATRKRANHTSVATGRSKPMAVVKQNRHRDGDGNFRALTVGMMRRVGRKRPVLVKTKRKKVGLWRGVGVKMGNYGRKGRFKKLYQPPKLKI